MSYNVDVIFSQLNHISKFLGRMPFQHQCERAVGSNTVGCGVRYNAAVTIPLHT